MHHTTAVLGDVIERNARYFSGKTAVVFEGRRVTFAEFAARARRFANVLAWGACDVRHASPCWRKTALNISRPWAPQS